MKIIKISNTTKKEILQQAIEALENGEIVIYPTETVYGVGVDATNSQAVEKLIRYKSRREGKPMSIAVTNKTMAAKYVELNSQAEKIYYRMLPGPYTVVSKDLGRVAKGVASEFATLGVRIPDYPFIAEMVEGLGRPITATSANASGKKRPYSVADIFDELSEKQKSLVDLVIDGGTLPKNEPSVIIDTTLSTPVALRGESGSISKLETSRLVSSTPDETIRIAGSYILKNWDQIKKTGLVVGISGPLGAGKTIFAKGVAKFLKIPDVVTSPTYSYMNEYDFNRYDYQGTFYHLDLWKIDNSKQLELLNIESLLAPSSVIVIEWWNQVAAFVKPDFKTKVLEINFEIKNNDLRIIKFNS